MKNPFGNMEWMKARMKEIDLKKEGIPMLRDYALLAAGDLLTAISFAFFFLPHDIAPGGVTGIATILASVFPLGVGLLSFLINLPLFALGFRQVGWRFAVRSFLAMMLLSLMIDLLPPCDLAGDRMLASLFGGVIMGFGLGLVVRAGATTGGTDMAAMLIHSRAGFLSVPVILFAIDAGVVTVAAAAFGIQAGLFALVELYVSAKAMDGVIKGFNTAMQFIIISGHAEEIIRRIHEDLGRGCTRLEARGTYEDRPMGTLMCVVSRMEAARLKKMVSQVDPRAFVTVCDVHEALGEGFTYETADRAPKAG